MHERSIGVSIALATVLVLGLWIGVATPAMAQSHPTLTTGRGGAETTPSTAPSQLNLVTRRRDVELNPSVFFSTLDMLQGRPGTTRKLDIAFFSDAVVTVTIDRFERPGRGVTVLHGSVDSDPLGQATITYSRTGGISVNVFRGASALQILPSSNGRYEAREINRSAYAESADDGVAAPAWTAIEDSNIVVAPTGGPGTTIDLLVAYTDVTRAAAGGTAAIESEIDMAVAVTNAAYANSGVTQRVRLVGTMEVPFAGDIVGQDIGTTLNTIAFTMPALQAQRDAVGADVVSFWVENGTGGVCGVGYLMNPVTAAFASAAYHVALRSCAVGNLTMAHEMGHNMGLNHDLYVAPGTMAPFPYGHGYVDPQHRFRTVMAYQNACWLTAPSFDCPRITAFSTPLRTYGGAVMGAAATADEARALNMTMATVAAFRTTVGSAGTLEMKLHAQDVAETVGSVQVAVTRLGGTSGAVSVHYATANGNAVAGTDYTATSGTLNWADGDAADKTISVPIAPNATTDGSRTFTVTLDTPGGGAELSLGNTTAVTIADDEPDAFPANCMMPTGFTMTAGATTGWAVANDSAGEGKCSLRSNLMAPPVPNDIPTLCSNVSKAQTQFTGQFVNGNVSFRARVASFGPRHCMRFSIDGADQNVGACGFGGDGFAPAPGQVETGWQDFSIPVGAGTHTLRWSHEIACISTAGGDDYTKPNFAWIDALSMPMDPATVSTVAFAQATSTAIEGALANMNIAVTRSGPATAALYAYWSTGDGSAVAGTDFGTAGSSAQKSGSVYWPAGDATPKNITVGLASANVPVINDTSFEADKDFTIRLVSVTGNALIGATDTNTVTIVDSESTIEFAATTATVGETGGNITLTINRTGSTALAQTVTFATANGTAMAPADYTAATGTITFAPGEASKTIAVGPNMVAAPYVKIMNDATVEPPETFTVTLSAPTSGAVLGADKTATVTILSEDSGITMAAAAQSFSEGAGPQQIMVNRAGPTAGQVTINYTITNGTAIRDTHFTSAAASGTLTWPDGDGTPKAIDVTPIDDGLINATRMFTVTLSAPTGAILAAPMSTAVSITSDDNLVQFYSLAQAVAENVAGGLVTIQLTRTGVITGSADVTYTTVDGTAVAGTDFGALGNAAAVTGTVSWPAGVGGTKTFTIPILNDAAVRLPRSFTVQLSSPVGPGVAVGPYGSITVTINDDDKGVTLELASYTVMEGVDPSVMIKVMRVGPTTSMASATWTTVNGNAVSGTDFGVLGNAAARTGTLSWAMGDATPKTITIPILNNVITSQPDRLFQVNLTPGAGMILGAYGAATVTIQDDDIPSRTSVQFSQPKYIVVENVGNAVLTLTRTDLGLGCALQSKVNFATLAGTALATSDYTTKTGTVTWAPSDGCVDKQITVAIVNNAVAEPPESFKVVLSGNNPGTSLGVPSTATVTILDDDEVFPAQCAVPAGFSVPGGVTAGWHVTSEPGAYEGVCALRSDQIDDGESAGLEMAGTFVAGNVSFRVKISSELNFDTLTFFVDGAPQPLTWSGTAITGWTASPNYPISAGAHALRWVYQKDANASVGMDAAFIDGLVTPAFTP